jgi:hypothetical protein
MMGLALLVSAVTILWVYVHREHRVVRLRETILLVFDFVSVPEIICGATLL